MKKLRFIITFVLATLAFGCSDDDNGLGDLQNIGAPTSVSGLFTITQDNTGTVTITPKGEGVSRYEVYFGDGTAEPAKLDLGQSVSHVYQEGQYSVKIVGYSMNGKMLEYNHDLAVSFQAPQNLEMAVTPVDGDTFSVNVTATADLETYFEVYFGEDPNQTPVQFNEGETVTHTYTAVGTYTVRVVAKSGGSATAEDTEEVTITNPLLLPIDFENPTLSYAFTDFGQAVTTVMDNPHIGGINKSSRVAEFKKNPGETWAGTFISTDEPIDFSTFTTFSIKVWSPIAGAPVILKIENAADPAIFHEQQAVTTVANQWEELEFNFAGAGTVNEYSKIVLFFNFGTAGEGESYFFDDISLVAGDTVLSFPITFESPVIDYTFTDFLGSATATTDNPDIGAGNKSAKVKQFFKPNGVSEWAGAWILMPEPIDFTVNQKIKMKVWSPTAGTPVIFKFENGPNTASIERNVSTTLANQWEEMTFDFTGIDGANQYQRIVIFFNAGNVGTGATYYFDDITLTN